MLLYKKLLLMTFGTSLVLYAAHTHTHTHTHTHGVIHNPVAEIA